jgi:hypothetical protein
MKRESEHPPTNDELKKAVCDLFYAAHQSASYGYLKLIERDECLTRLKAKIPDLDPFLHNVFVELSLLFIRKTTEFFKPGKSANSDTLYACLYLPEWKCVWVVDKTDYIEMHKRVGHITIREARYGKKEWPLEAMTVSALNHWRAFFRDLPTSPIYEGVPPKSELKEYEMAFEAMADGCGRIFAI